jgi:hypothetical protein
MKITGAALMTAEHLFRTFRRKGSFGPFADLNTGRRELSALPGMPACDFGDFGRGGMTVRKMTLTALLAAWDSGDPQFEDAGVIGWNGCGCTAENLTYWRDYVSNGREAGRGGLFVATLPTIPCCETAIALHCRGPAAYFRTRPSLAALQEILADFPPGRFFCSEMTAGTVCVLLADTRLPGDALPENGTLAVLFAGLEAGS